MIRFLSPSSKIRESLILALVCLVFLAVVLFLNSYHTEPLFKKLPTEPDFVGQYLPDAYRVLEGKPPLDRWRGPLYSVVLALSSFVQEDLFENAKLISALSGAAFLIITYLIARQVSDRNVALLTLLLGVSSPIVLLYSCAVGTDMLFAALTFGSLYLYLRAMESLRWTCLLPAGILAGLGFMTRGSGVVLPAVVVVSLLLSQADSRSRIWGLVAFLVPMLVVCIPWIYMNYQLYDVPFQSDEYLTVAYTFYGRGQWQAFWQDEFMAEDRTFRSWVEVLTRDPVLLLTTWPRFLVRDLAYFARDMGWTVAGLAFLGMILGTRHGPWSRQVKVLLAFGGASLLLISLVYYDARFYLVILPLWLLAAAWAISCGWRWAAERIGQQRWLWLGLAVVALLLGFSVVASVELVWRVFTSPSEATAEDYLWFAEGYRQNGLRGLAVEYYDKAVKAEPDSCLPLVDFAEARRFWGQEEGALALYRKALFLDGGCWQGYLGLGKLYLQKGKISDAAVSFDMAAKAAPDPVDIYVEIGALYFASGLADDAQIFYERALNREPLNPLANVGLAKVRQEQGDREGALSLYERAVTAAPDMVEPYLALGKAFRSWEMWKEALETYVKGLEVHPRVVELLLGMAEVYRTQGEMELALIKCQEAIKLAPEGALPYLSLGDIYSDLEMVGEAVDAYRQAARRLPPLPVVHLRLGNLYRNHGREEEAIAAYDEAIRLDPASSSLYLIKGDACRRWGRVEEAMASYARALELDPELRGDLKGYEDLVSFLEGRVVLPGDLVAFSRDWQERFLWYYSGGRVDIEEGSLVLEGLSLEGVRPEISWVESGAGKVWLVLFRQPELDPQSQVERMLDEWGYRAVNQWYGEHRLVVYGLPMDGSGGEWAERRVNFGDEVMVEGYKLERSEVRAGGVVKLAVRWRALKAVGVGYKVFVHLVGADGRVWGQVDTVPGNGLVPTSGWEEGDAVEDRYGVLVSPDVEPGTYELRIGMYDEDGGKRLENLTEASSSDAPLDYCALATVEVKP